MIVRASNVFIAFLLLGSLGAAAADSPGAEGTPLTPQQALGRQGQKVAVKGVASISDALGLPGIFIRLTGPGSNIPFVGYIENNNQRQFPSPRELEGKTIEIIGVVETSGSIPMIRLTSADQMKIIR
jgi:hypothetical protein